MVLVGSKRKGLVDFMHATYFGNIDPRVSRDRDYVDAVFDGIDMYNHHHLCEDSWKDVFLVVITSKQQNVPGSPGDDARIGCRINDSRRLIFFATDGMVDFPEWSLYLRVEIIVAVRHTPASQQEKEQAESQCNTWPSHSALARLDWSLRFFHCERGPWWLSIVLDFHRW